MRVRAAQIALALADSYREQGSNVMLMLDSLTRLAMAQREMVCSSANRQARRGYTPSVFQLLATTVERLGNSANAGITALLTVLVDGDDLEEPISDAIRSLVDGHIVLDRKIAERGDTRRSTSPAASAASPMRSSIRNTSRPLESFAAILNTYSEVHDLIRICATAFAAAAHKSIAPSN